MSCAWLLLYALLALLAAVALVAVAIYVRCRGLYAFVWRNAWFGVPRFQPNMAAARAYGRAARDTDVIVAVPSKSGTTLTQHICHQLRVRGAEPDFASQQDVMPWIECPYMCGYRPAAELEQPGDVRVFKSHLRYRELLDTNMHRRKLVYVFRNLVDRMRSIHPFVCGLMQVDTRTLPLADFTNFICLLRFAHFDVRLQLESLCDFWLHRNDDNVLFLFFDDLIAQREQCIRDIARFMEVRADDALVRRVAEQTSHTVMCSPEHWHRFSESKIVHDVQRYFKLSEQQLVAHVGKVRKGGGKSGEGRAVVPKWFQRVVDATWRDVVTERIGFNSLEEMRAAWRAERAAATAGGGGGASGSGHGDARAGESQ